MASALAALANASVTFQVPGIGMVTDPDTGNVSPVVETVTVSLFLKVRQMEGTVGRFRLSDRVNYPGVDLIEAVYDGYAMAALDSRIRIGTTGTLTFASETPVPCEVSELRLAYGKTGLLGSVLASTLGETIQLVSRAQS